MSDIESDTNSNSVKSKKVPKRIRNDLILLGVIFLIVIIAGGIYLATRNEGSYAVVSIDGSVYAKYKLSENITVELPIGQDGNNRNVLMIEDGKVSVLEADCRDKICVNHSPISKTGETIVCLPNRMVIEIVEGG